MIEKEHHLPSNCMTLGSMLIFQDQTISLAKEPGKNNLPLYCEMKHKTSFNEKHWDLEDEWFLTGCDELVLTITSFWHILKMFSKMKESLGNTRFVCPVCVNVFVFQNHQAKNLVTLSTYFQISHWSFSAPQLWNRNMNGEVWVCKRAEDVRRSRWCCEDLAGVEKKPVPSRLGDDSVDAQHDRMDTLWISQARDACAAGLGFFFNALKTNMSL